MYFNNPTSTKDLQDQFKQLAIQHHESSNKMQKINQEYEQLAQQLEIEPSSPKQTEEDKKIRETLTKVAALPLKIEICGCWIWVSGKTYHLKEQLKEIGFQWSSSKKKWHWAPYKIKKKKRYAMKMKDIRNKYGSHTINTDE